MVVLEIVVKMAVTRMKFQFLEEGLILHDVQGIENIVIFQFCHDECVIHELQKWSHSVI